MFQGLSAGFSIAGYKMETRKEKEVEQANEVHRGDGLQRSGERITTDCRHSRYLFKCFKSSSNISLLLCSAMFGLIRILSWIL